MPRDLGDMRLLYTPSAEIYAKQVYKSLLPHFEERYRGEFPKDNPLIPVKVSYFPNKEIRVQITKSVRKRDVFVFHSFRGYSRKFDPNIGLVELSLLDDALGNADPETITYVEPYMPYQRQDRRDRPRVALSAARTLRMGFDSERRIPTRLVTFDMHSPQQQGFNTSIIVENLPTLPLFVKYCTTQGLLENTFAVSPDRGGTERASDFAGHLANTEFYIMNKNRQGPGKSNVLHVVGPVEQINGNRAIIIDDMIDTGGTLVDTAGVLRKHGASEVYAFATHGILSAFNGSSCEEKLRASGIKVVITDTIPRSTSYYQKNKDWLTPVSTSEMIAAVIYRLQRGLSVSELYSDWGIVTQ